MSSKRIVLNFEEPVYFEESRVWYVLDQQLTPTVNDIIVDFVRQLDCNDGWNLYVNEVIAPRWTSSTVICSENDFVKVLRTKDSNLKHSDIMNTHSDKVDPADRDISVGENQAIHTTAMDQSKTSESNKTLEFIKVKQKPPLKISNNFKRKFSDTTPTHRDRYTNRSKIFVSPGIVKNAKSSVPVVAALKTAVKETLTYSSPIQAKRNMTPECKTVTDSFHKTRVFHDKVTTLLSKAETSVQVINLNSDSDSSMTSDTSSDNDSCKRNAKRARTDQNKAVDSSASSTEKSSIEEKSAPGIRDPKACATINKSKDYEQMSILKPSETNNQPAKAGQILENPEPSSTDSEAGTDKENNQSSSDENDGGDSNKSKTKSITPLKSIGKKDSNDTSDDSDDEKSGKEVECDDSGSDSESEEKSGNEMNCGTIVSKANLSIKDNPMTVAQVPVSKDYSVFISLEGTPRISDKLAFKMLDLNDSYCPVISDYKEGIITEYNSSSQIIVVKLLPTFVDMNQRKGKFELDESRTCSSEFLELNLKQLIEPKILT